MDVLFKGWVFKQSRILKRLNEEWLELSEDTLTVYKKCGGADCKIQLNEILTIEKLGVRNDLCRFKICTSKQELVFLADPLNAELWISHINASKFNSESKSSRTEQMIRKMFQRIQDELAQREEALLKQNAVSIGAAKEKAIAQIECVNRNLGGLEEKHREFKQKKESGSIFQLPRVEASKEEDLETPKIEVNLTPSLLQKTINDNTKLECVNPHELSVTRSQITRALKWRYSGDKIDALSFCVSQDTVLTGIGLCRPYRPDGSITINRFSVLVGRSTDCKSAYNHNSKVNIDFAKGSSVFKLKMNSPFLLKKGQIYTVCFIIEGAPTYKCVDCKALCRVGNLNWQFFNTEFSNSTLNNRTDSVCGPIASFYYSERSE